MISFPSSSNRFSSNIVFLAFLISSSALSISFVVRSPAAPGITDIALSAVSLSRRIAATPVFFLSVINKFFVPTFVSAYIFLAILP